MNLRQHENHAEKNTKAKAWYCQPETLQTVQTAEQEMSPALFEPSAAERILARAGALQEVHGQMLSQEQIEAVAQEIGIKPEFIRLAIEQESAGIVPHPVVNQVAKPEAPLQSRRRAKIRVAMIASSSVTVAAIYLAVYFSKVDGAAVGITMLTFPLILSFVLGALGQSRRWGAVSGLAVAVAALTALCFIWLVEATTPGIPVLSIFSTAIASSTLVGVAARSLDSSSTIRRVCIQCRTRRPRSALYLWAQTLPGSLRCLQRLS